MHRCEIPFPPELPHRSNSGEKVPSLALKDPAQQKARALKMLEAKILDGKTTEEIAQQFGVSPATVYKAMSLAKKAEIVVKFEDRLYNELLPLAHSAVMGALQDGNAKIGLAVLQGTQVLRPNQPRSANALAEDDELSRYINQKRAQAALDEATHEGIIVPAELPAGTVAEIPSLETGPAGPGPESALSGPGSEQDEPQGAPDDRPAGFTRAQALLGSGRIGV